MIFLAKFITLFTNIMDNNVYIFLHITLVTVLSTADLSLNFSESNYIYLYYKCYNLCSHSTNSLGVLRIIIQTLHKNSCYIIIQPLAKFNCKHISCWVYYGAHYSILDNIVTHVENVTKPSKTCLF